jgi:hypothetical protein
MRPARIELTTFGFVVLGKITPKADNKQSVKAL